MTPTADPPTENSRRPRAAARGALAVPLGAGLLGAVLLLTACSSQPSGDAHSPAQQGEHTAQSPSAESSPAPAHPQTTGMEMPAAAPSHTHAPGTAPHLDHDSKHGGDFFMALDEKHHLEGVLTAPDTFRVYLFDEYSKPLAKASLAQADAKVTWGKADNAPETALKPSADGLTLEARAPAKITFPTELTLRIRLPGATAGSRSELFTFPFKAYTHDPAPHKH